MNRTRTPYCTAMAPEARLVCGLWQGHKDAHMAWWVHRSLLFVVTWSAS